MMKYEIEALKNDQRLRPSVNRKWVTNGHWCARIRDFSRPDDLRSFAAMRRAGHPVGSKRIPDEDIRNRLLLPCRRRLRATDLVVNAQSPGVARVRSRVLESISGASLLVLVQERYARGLGLVDPGIELECSQRSGHGVIYAHDRSVFLAPLGYDTESIQRMLK